jgi:hypothetical protein
VKDVTVVAPGTPVKIGPAGDRIDAVITAVQIRESGVSYLVAWFDGRQRREEYVTLMEVYAVEVPVSTTRVGFTT